MFDFDPNKKVFVLVFLEGCIFEMPQTINAIEFFTLRSFFFKRDSLETSN